MWKTDFENDVIKQTCINITIFTPNKTSLFVVQMFNQSGNPLEMQLKLPNISR